MTVPLFPEIEPHQLVAAKLKDISATVGMADFCSLIIAIHYRDTNSLSFLDNLGQHRFHSVPPLCLVSADIFVREIS